MSYAGELYVYGGIPTDIFLHAKEHDPNDPWFSAKRHEEHFMMKLDKDTHH